MIYNDNCTLLDPFSPLFREGKDMAYLLAIEVHKKGKENLEGEKTKIIYEDDEGNKFQFYCVDGYAVLEFIRASSPVVRIPSWVRDDKGIRYPLKALDGGCYSDQVIKHLIIPEGVEYIFGTIAGHCGSLMSVEFPSTLKGFVHAFWNCPQFEVDGVGRIYYYGTKERWEELVAYEPYRPMMDSTPNLDVIRFVTRENPFRIPEIEYDTREDKETGRAVASLRLCNQSGAVVIEGYYDDPEGHRFCVEEIGINAFSLNSEVTRVVIPASVKRIRRDAFYLCANLEEVMIEKGDSDILIESGAFYQCEKLKFIRMARKGIFKEHALGMTNAKILEE